MRTARKPMQNADQPGSMTMRVRTALKMTMWMSVLHRSMFMFVMMNAASLNDPKPPQTHRHQHHPHNHFRPTRETFDRNQITKRQCNQPHHRHTKGMPHAPAKAQSRPLTLPRRQRCHRSQMIRPRDNVNGSSKKSQPSTEHKFARSLTTTQTLNRLKTNDTRQCA